MTKLTEEIKISIEKLDRETPRPLTSEDQAEAASEVCKGYIQRAWVAAELRGRYIEQLDSKGWSEYEHTDFGKWLKSEGITE